MSVGYEQAAYSVQEGEDVTVCVSVMSGVLTRNISITSVVIPGTALGIGGKLANKMASSGSSRKLWFDLWPLVSFETSI